MFFNQSPEKDLFFSLPLILVSLIITSSFCVSVVSGQSYWYSTVETPTFSPGTGTYNSSQVVFITCDTEGAVICYTTDGSEPSSWSFVYSVPIIISVTTTIKAMAFVPVWADSSYGLISSEIAQATYAIKVSTPTFSLTSGTYYSAQNVLLDCNTMGAEIRYTTDGSEPNGYSTLYFSAIPINTTTVIRAKAFKSNMAESDTALATYTITVDPKQGPHSQPQIGPQPEQSRTKVFAPNFTPSGGMYSRAQNVVLGCATLGATLFYTLDGSEPSTASAVYSSPLLVDASITVKAKALKGGMIESDTATATYVITLPKVAAPSFSLGGGSYPGAQYIVIRCPTPSAVILYTTDGSEPSPSSLMYSGPIPVSVTTTIRAKAFMFSGMNESDMVSATYTIGTDGGIQHLHSENALVYFAVTLVAVVAVVGGLLFYLRAKK